MSDEIYDVVDEQGDRLLRASWRAVHAHGLLHPTVAVLVFRTPERNEILIQRRSMDMAQMPGLLQHSAGGHVPTGMPPERAARAELREELFADGMDGIDPRFVTRFLQEDFPGNRELMHVFETVHPGPFTPGPEVSEVFWQGWDDLLLDARERPDSYTPSFHLILLAYRADR